MHSPKQLLLIAAVLLNSLIQAQTVSTFETIVLPADSFNDGRTVKGGFNSGNAYFENYYDTSFQDWAGFAISTKADSVTKGYTNQYAAITKTGYAQSKTYAVAYDQGMIRLTGAAKSKQVDGCYITNSTYAYFDMLNGSAFSKKFGGSTGKDPDFFAVVFTGWKGSNRLSSKVTFYLADFRDTNNTKDYLVRTWQWVNLKPLGDVDSIDFEMISSDTGSFGINTPTYFCMDNFTTTDHLTGLVQQNLEPQFSVYPVPFRDQLIVQSVEPIEAVKIFDLKGSMVKESNVPFVSTADLLPGMYVLQVQANGQAAFRKIVKE